MNITRQNYDKVLYCPICGSSNISVKVWYDQSDEKFQDPLEAVNEDCYCSDCECNTEPALTIKELWTKWKCFETKYVDENKAITRTFLGFSEGTPVFDIVSWFDTRCPVSVYTDLILPTREMYFTKEGDVCVIKAKDKLELDIKLARWCGDYISSSDTYRKYYQDKGKYKGHKAWLILHGDALKCAAYIDNDE